MVRKKKEGKCGERMWKKFIGVGINLIKDFFV